jgi:thioredoxin reductase
MYDVIIIGGGPAGLSAALALGRARKRVLVCDAGPRRNAAATHINGFVTRDGTPPDEFRRIAREQLATYGVAFRDEGAQSIEGERGDFAVRVGSDVVHARRILLATGMIDILPEIEGFREHWGKTIFICPYCHAWEVQDRRFGFIAPNVEMLLLATLLRSWTDDVIVFTNGAFAVPDDTPHHIEERRIQRVLADGVALEDGTRIDLGALFIKPPQKQVPVVASLELNLDAGGYIVVNEQRQTSIDGIYAGGDLVTSAQSAIFAAASGYQAAAALNVELTATEQASRRARAGTSG